ncbi:hypothetical protein FOVSG1_014247 [Fusarium oxysporum f. sp. vasinfectum]
MAGCSVGNDLPETIDAPARELAMALIRSSPGTLDLLLHGFNSIIPHVQYPHASIDWLVGKGFLSLTRSLALTADGAVEKRSHSQR